ncbi:ABC transporter permease subunit [Leptospira interrogans]
MRAKYDLSHNWPAPRAYSRVLSPWVPLLPVLLFLTVVMVYPVGQLLLLTVQTRDGAFTTDHYQRLFSNDIYVQVLLITLKISAWTTLISVVVSYPVAYLIATSRPEARSHLMFWVILPFWTSFLVRTFAWIVILGRGGVLNQFLQAAGITDAPQELIYNLRAVLIGMSHAMIPLCIMTMVSVMEAIDGNLSKAALTLGARPGNAFWRIYFPLSLPGLAAGGLLVFITALGFFITPAFLGGRRETMITQIIIEQVVDLLNWSFAGVLSMLLLAAGLAVFAIYDRLLGLSNLAGGAGRQTSASVSGEGLSARAGRRILNALGSSTDSIGGAFRRVFPLNPGKKSGRFGRSTLWVVVIVILLFLCLPAFLMVPVSFTESVVIDWPPAGFTLRWYEAFWQSPLWMQATVRSLIVATGAAILAMAIGGPAAFALARRRLPGKAAILGFLMAPLIIPRIIIAVALFYFYARVGLVGSYAGLIIGHGILAVPYVVITMMAVLKTYDTRYDQAAASLGATPVRTLQHITLPILKGGLISAFLFAFITSFDELTIALFVTGGLTTTLPKQMWDDAILRVTPTLASASTMLLMFLTGLIFVAERLQQRRRGRKQSP